jgi:hypothetical protein
MLLGITAQVINDDGDAQVNCTVPVTPGAPVINSPKNAVPPGVVLAMVEPPDGTVIITWEFEELNVAVTAFAAVMVTTHAAVPVHAPLQPANTEPSDALCVRVTCVPLAKLAEHAVGQVIPAGALLTVPAPVPASVTVNAKLLALAVKFAATVVAAVIVNVHVPVPSQGPAPQPANVDPFVGVAVNTICVPLAKLAVHAVPQLIPAGALVTVPVPVPPFVTVNATAFEVLNVAVTIAAAVNVTTQAPLPLHAPLHPAKVEPAAAVCVNVTIVPLAKVAVHAVPQLIPAGALVTVPVPVPASATVSNTLVPVLNVAVTATSAAAIGTVQVGGAVCGLAGTQFALNAARVDPTAAVAVNVTELLSGNAATHIAGQLIPAGALVIVPVPVPFTVIVRLLFPVIFSPKIASPEAWPVGEAKVTS